MSALVPYDSESIKTPLKEKPDKEKSLKDGTLMEMDYKSCVKVTKFLTHFYPVEFNHFSSLCVHFFIDR